MNGFGLTDRLTMCNHKIYASKIVALSIFMEKTFVFICILLRICFSSQEKKFLAITPLEQMQTPLFYWLLKRQPHLHIFDTGMSSETPKSFGPIHLT